MKYRHLADINSEKTENLNILKTGTRESVIINRF